MEVHEGIVRDRVVVLPEGVQLKEGSRVEVRIPEAMQNSPEELFKKRLVDVGLVERIGRPSAPLVDQDRAPILVKGKTLSAQIIEERR